MKLLFVLLALVLCAEEEATPSKSVVLTSANFDREVSQKAAIVKFYAPWCGHCKHLAPEWAKLADMYANAKDVLVGEVDCDAQKQLCSEHGVRGYPTILYFPKGETTADIKYEGERNADGLARFVVEKSGTRGVVKATAVRELSPEQFNDVVYDADMNVLVAFTAPWCGHCQHLKPEFEKAAQSFRAGDKVLFVRVDADKNDEYRTKFDVSGFPTLKFFRAGKKDKTAEEYSGGRDAADFVQFMNKEVGTERVLGGGLLNTAGVVEAFVPLASRIVDSVPEGREAIVKEAKEKLATLPAKDIWSAQYYIKVMETIQSRGLEYVPNEIARLTKMLDSKNLNLAKMDEFTKKLHILKSFQ